MKQKMTQYEKMTATPVHRLVLTLALPSIVTMLINNIYNLVDTAFVGRLGTSASGAVGVVFGFMSIIQAFGFMFGTGCGSILSRALGNQDKESASLHASAGFFAAILFGLLITVSGFLFLDWIVMFLGSTVTIAPYAKTYISYILAAAPFMCSSLVMNNILRYEGKATLGMIGLMTGAVLNMIGDPILMFGLDMGIAGAGLSTAASQLISWGILLFMFLSGRTAVSLKPVLALRAGLPVYGDIMATGAPSLLRQGLNSLNTVVLNAQCAPYGDAAVAGMSIVARIIFFAFSAAVGVGQGLQPVSAFNYGANRYSRVREAYRFTLMFSMLIMLIGCTGIFIFADHLVGFFRNDPAVIAVGTRALRLHAVGYLFLPICMVTEMTYQSTGHRAGASFLAALRSGLLSIPMILILAKLRGLPGIQEAQPAAILLSLPVAVLLAVRFFKEFPATDGDMPAPGIPLDG